jgi:hypothetical protein
LLNRGALYPLDHAGFAKPGDAPPGAAACIIVRKDGVPAIEHGGADEIFKTAEVDLRPSVAQDIFSPFPW